MAAFTSWSPRADPDAAPDQAEAPADPPTPPTPPGFAQQTSGNIMGRVLDPQASAVPGVTMRVISRRTSFLATLGSST